MSHGEKHSWWDNRQLYKLHKMHIYTGRAREQSGYSAVLHRLVAEWQMQFYATHRSVNTSTDQMCVTLTHPNWYPLMRGYQPSSKPQNPHSTSNGHHTQNKEQYCSIEHACSQLLDPTNMYLLITVMDVSLDICSYASLIPNPFPVGNKHPYPCP